MEILFIFLLFMQSTDPIFGEGPLCFLCADMSKAYLCDQITRCKDGQLCYVEKHVTTLGYEHYSSGCADVQQCGNGTSSVQTINPDQSVERRRCTECCHRDFCNNKGCGDTGLPSRNVRGPICFNCNYLTDPRECARLTICAKTEDCAVLEKKWILFEKKYELGCKQGCTAITSDHLSDQKETCCDKDFCNSPLVVNRSVNGSWSDWTQWSQCNATCDGHRLRQRTCTDPAPFNGGQVCTGVSMEIGSCSPCPVNGQWSVWSSWTSCYPTCGGFQTRTRACNNPIPANGGTTCVGNSSESAKCVHNKGSCDHGYTYLEEYCRCYKLSSHAMHYNQSRAQCKSEGSDLIIFDSGDELTRFRSILKQSSVRDNVYAGYRGKSGSFTWLNGTTLPVVSYGDGGLWWPNAGHDSGIACGCLYQYGEFWLEDCCCECNVHFLCGHHI